MSACRSCGATIIWVRTERGKKMPLDAEPVADATAETRSLFVLRDRGSADGPLAIAAWGLEGTEPHFKCHFDTCGPRIDSSHQANGPGEVDTSRGPAQEVAAPMHFEHNEVTA